MSYEIYIGALNNTDHDSEMEVETVDEAVAYLYALALKRIPEQACANIGDFKTLVGNNNLTRDGLANASQQLRAMVDELIRDEDESDERARKDCGIPTYYPDLTIRQINPSTVEIVSMAMRYERYVSLERVAEEIESVTREYNDLIEAGELSTPGF